MKTLKEKYRGKLELDTLDQLNSIASDIKDVRGLCIILSQYFDENRKADQSRLYEYYGVLNEQIMQLLLDLSDEVYNIVSEIEVLK